MKLFKGKKIYVVDEDFTTVTGLVERDGKIVATGEFDSLKEIYPEAKVDTSFEDKYIYPGFVEPHAHPMFAANILGNCTLIDFKKWDFGKYGVVEACLTADEMRRRIKKDVENTEKDSHVFYGYNVLRHGEITRKEIDEYSTEKPIVLLYATGHGAIMNTKASEMFGFTEIPNDTFGCGLYEDGTHSGVYVETAYMPHISHLSSITSKPENLDRGKKLFLENAKINGIVAVAEYIGGATSGVEKEVEFYQELATDEYPIHSSFLVNYQHISNMTDNDNKKTYEYIRSFEEKYDTENFKFMKALKFFFDGAVIDHQIKLSMPLTNGYEGEWNYDFKGHNMDTFVDDMLDYWKAGYDFYVHSQGDESQLAIVHKLKELQDRFKREDYIASIQHFAFSNDEFFDYVKANDLHVQISALPLYVDIWPMWEKAGLYPKKVLTEQFLRLKDIVEDEHYDLSMHSDCSNNPNTPMNCMYKAVTRIDISGNPVKDARDQRIDVKTALRAITIEAAKQDRNEDKFGSLEAGKRASFVVYKEDFIEGAPELLQQKLDALIMDGKEVTF